MPATSSPPRYSRLRHSGGALAHSLSATAWRQVIELRPADPTVALSLRVGLATLIVLIGGGLLGYGQVSGFAATGALCSAFCRYEPYPRLAAKLAGVGVGIVVFTGFGATLGALGTSVGTQILCLSIGAGVSYWLLTAFLITGPGSVVMIFAAAGAAGFATTAHDVRLVVAAVAAGASIGWVVAMLPALSHPHGPSRVATARALASVSAIESAGRTAVPAARQAIAGAREVIACTPRHRVDAHTVELLEILDAAEKAIDDEPHPQPHDFNRLAVELRKVRHSFRTAWAAAGRDLVGHRPRGFIRESLGRLGDRSVLAGVGRITLASVSAGGFAAAAGLHPPLWATIGAMAALQGINYHHTVQRAIQRLLGNVLGALLATGLFVLDLDYWPLVAVIVVCTTLTEMSITRNYAVGTVFITAMALLLTGLAEPAGADIAVTRVGDTLVGVAIGVVVAALTISRGDHHHVRGRS